MASTFLNKLCWQGLRWSTAEEGQSTGSVLAFVGGAGGGAQNGDSASQSQKRYRQTHTDSGSSRRAPWFSLLPFGRAKAAAKKKYRKEDSTLEPRAGLVASCFIIITVYDTMPGSGVVVVAMLKIALPPPTPPVLPNIQVMSSHGLAGGLAARLCRIWKSDTLGKSG